MPRSEHVHRPTRPRVGHLHGLAQLDLVVDEHVDAVFERQRRDLEVGSRGELALQLGDLGGDELSYIVGMHSARRRVERSIVAAS